MKRDIERRGSEGDDAMRMQKMRRKQFDNKEERLNMQGVRGENTYRNKNNI